MGRLFYCDVACGLSGMTPAIDLLCTRRVGTPRKVYRPSSILTRAAINLQKSFEPKP